MLEKDSRKAPIHLALGTHSDEHIQSLDQLEQIARDYLVNNSEGKVVWFIENAARLPNEILSELDQLREQGASSQIDALFERFYLPRFPRNLQSSPIFRLSARKKFLSCGFYMSELQKADGLNESYPGRVVISFEKATQLLPPKAMQAALSGEVRSDYQRLFLIGNFHQAALAFKEMIDDLKAGYTEKRDLDIAQGIDDEAKRPDVLSMVGHLGCAHTGVYHFLKSQGHDVPWIFPQKEGKVYHYKPTTAASRALRFNQDSRFSDVQWTKWMIQAGIFTVLRERRDQPKMWRLLLRPEHPVKKLVNIVARFTVPYITGSDQALLNLIYSKTYHLNERGIESFQHLIKERTMGLAIKALLEGELADKEVDKEND